MLKQIIGKCGICVQARMQAKNHEVIPTYVGQLISERCPAMRMSGESHASYDQYS
jgi:hypothetical protein